VNIIAVAAFAASVSKTSVFELRDEFPYLGWHLVFPILFRDALGSL